MNINELIEQTYTVQTKYKKCCDDIIIFVKMYIDWSDIEIKCALDKRLYINVNLPATKYDYRFGYCCSVEDFFEYVKDKTIVSPEDFIKLCN